MADVIWTSEVPDFFQMKRTACSKLMFPPETNNIVNPIPNFDGSFTPNPPRHTSNRHLQYAFR